MMDNYKARYDELSIAVKTLLACKLYDTVETAYFQEGSYPNWPTQSRKLLYAIQELRRVLDL